MSEGLNKIEENKQKYEHIALSMFKYYSRPHPNNHCAIGTEDTLCLMPDVNNPNVLTYNLYSSSQGESEEVGGESDTELDTRDPVATIKIDAATHVISFLAVNKESGLIEKVATAPKKIEDFDKWKQNIDSAKQIDIAFQAIIRKSNFTGIPRLDKFDEAKSEYTYVLGNRKFKFTAEPNDKNHYIASIYDNNLGAQKFTQPINLKEAIKGTVDSGYRPISRDDFIDGTIEANTKFFVIDSLGNDKIQDTRSVYDDRNRLLEIHYESAQKKISFVRNPNNPDNFHVWINADKNNPASKAVNGNINYFAPTAIIDGNFKYFNDNPVIDFEKIGGADPVQAIPEITVEKTALREPLPVDNPLAALREPLPVDNPLAALREADKAANSAKPPAPAEITISKPAAKDIERITSLQQLPNNYSDLTHSCAEMAEIPSDALAAIVMLESSYNPSDVNAKSGATGFGQFKPSTWKLTTQEDLHMINGKRQTLAQAFPQDDWSVGAMTQPKQNMLATAFHTRTNLDKVAEKFGVEKSPEEATKRAYYLHNLGETGGTQFIENLENHPNQTPSLANTPAAQIDNLKKNAGLYMANGKLLTFAQGDKNVGEFLDKKLHQAVQFAGYHSDKPIEVEERPVLVMSGNKAPKDLPDYSKEQARAEIKGMLKKYHGGEVMVFDRGHGGNYFGKDNPKTKAVDRPLLFDPGAVCNGFSEIMHSNAVEKHLLVAAEKKGLFVVCTSDIVDKYKFTSKAESLYARSFVQEEVARQLGGKVEVPLVSLHTNAAANKTASGMDILRSNGNSESIALAESLKKQYVAACKKTEMPTHEKCYDRGATEGKGVLILNSKQNPSALIEGGFLTTDKDREQLKKPESQKALAEAICDGVKGYLQRGKAQELVNDQKPKGKDVGAADDAIKQAAQIMQNLGGGGSTLQEAEKAALIASNPQAANFGRNC